MTDPRRLPAGGRLLDRQHTIGFTLDNTSYQGYAGDTAASALLANGVRVLGRSVLLDRPRGPVTADPAEPNALLHVSAPEPVPMLAATEIQLVEGMVLRTLAGRGILNGGAAAAHDRPDGRPDHGYLHVDTLDLDLERGTVTLPLPGPDSDLRNVEAQLVGEYDHGWVLAVVGRRLEHVRARTVRRHGAATVREVPLLFPGNDRPGVMLAGAVLTYLEDYAVRPGQRAVLVTDHDGGLRAAERLRSAGVEVLDVVDHRERRRVTGTYGNGGPELAAVTLSDGSRIECDLVVVSGQIPDSVPVLDCDPATALDLRDSFVDLERDVTVADLARAVGQGLRSIELIKRHTLLGTGPAQGRLASRLATATIAELLGVDRAEVGSTRSRPPARPVRIDVLAGRHQGSLFDPVRVTALHDWHVAHGAVFEDVGQWKRPRYFPRRGPTGIEDMDAAVDRECRAARGSVAMMDASTLGKIELHGPDVGIFLDRIYTNRMSTLKPGRCRYGMLCGADGMVLDDGVVARLPTARLPDMAAFGPDSWSTGEPNQHFYATTTTGNAAAVLDWMEEWLRTEWPELRVTATSVTDHWATIALVGPRSDRLLAELAPDLDTDPSSFGFMTVRTNESDPACTVAGVRDCRIFRVSFSGELAYEINVPWWYASTVWEALIGLGVTPYGTETMHVLRAEQGFPIVGQETDGTVTPYDLGMEWIVSAKKDFVGRRSFARPDTTRTNRRRMVGLFPDDPAQVLPEGAQLVRGEVPVGYVTSSYPSATLGRSFALAMVADAVEGQQLVAPLPDHSIAVRVTSPRFLAEPTRNEPVGNELGNAPARDVPAPREGSGSDG